MLVVFRRRFLLKLCPLSSGPLAMGPTIFFFLPLFWSSRAGSLPYLALQVFLLACWWFLLGLLSWLGRWPLRRRLGAPHSGWLGWGLRRSPCGLFYGIGWCLLRSPYGLRFCLLCPSAQHLLSSSLWRCVFGRAPNGPVVGAVTVVALLSPTFHLYEPQSLFDLALFAHPVYF